MVDIPSFLRTYPPFDALDEETLARVVPGTEIAVFPGGGGRGDVLGTREGLPFLSASLRRRMVRALEGLEADRADPWRIDVERLIRREPIRCESAAPGRGGG